MLERFLHFLWDESLWHQTTEDFVTLHEMTRVRIPNQTQQPRCPIATNKNPEILVPGLPILHWAHMVIWCMENDLETLSSFRKMASHRYFHRPDLMLYPNLPPLPVVTFVELMHALDIAGICPLVESEPLPTGMLRAAHSSGAPANAEVEHRVLKSFVLVRIWSVIDFHICQPSYDDAHGTLYELAEVASTVPDSPASFENNFLAMGSESRKQVSDLDPYYSASIVGDWLPSGLLGFRDGSLCISPLARQVLAELCTEYGVELDGPWSSATG